MSDILAINLGRRLAFTEAGEEVQITNMFDSDGDDTDDPAEAVSFVARVREDCWVSARVDSFGAEAN